MNKIQIDVKDYDWLARNGKTKHDYKLIIQPLTDKVTAYINTKRSLKDADRVNLYSYAERVVRRVCAISPKEYDNIPKSQLGYLQAETSLVYEIGTSCDSTKTRLALLRELRFKSYNWRYNFIKLWIDERIRRVKYYERTGR